MTAQQHATPRALLLLAISSTPHARRHDMVNDVATNTEEGCIHFDDFARPAQHASATPMRDILYQTLRRE